MRLDQKALAAGLLTFAGVLGISEEHLFNRDSAVQFVEGKYFTKSGSITQSFLRDEYQTPRRSAGT